ncbi:MAG: MATE family efflux transporter [Lachnospiraceae bacterium]|jgi:putative MATE family efflux protein|nr:MATE family efflux transporter [Lachnospiraceae bacterium]
MMKQTKNIDLLNGPIFPSLTGLAMPIMATALVQMAYNLTDMAWIGRVGAGAVTSVGTAGMYTWLSQGVAMFAKMGGQVKVAHSLGEGNKEEAAKYAGGALQLGIFLALCYGAAAIAFARPLIGFFGLNSARIIEDAVGYMRITCGCIIFMYLNVIFTGILTAAGDSKTSFQANVAGLAANMVLDPLLIFGKGPFPAMGAAGAAVATVTAQFIVTAIFLMAVRRDKMIFDKVNIFSRTPARYFKTMAKIGFPAAVQELIYCVISMGMTRLVVCWGDTGVAVQRVGSQIESISWMTAEGFGAAVNSFIGQNYGARKYDRVKKGYLTAIKTMAVWGAFSTALLVLAPGPIFRLFIHEPEVVPLGIDYLKILGCSQLFMCIEIATVGSFSGLGKTLPSSVLSVVFTSARLPVAAALSATALGINGIWWAFTATSIVKGIIFFAGFLIVLKRMERES